MKSSSRGNWEEEELENPVGRTEWVLNSINNELTVRSTVEAADGEDVPWDDVKKDVVSAVLLEGVAFICYRAFSCCWDLQSAQIPKSVAFIGDEAFSYCFGLRSVVIPDSVETIGSDAFERCRIASIRIPRSVTSFRGNPFPCCDRLEEVDVSDNPNFVYAEGVLMDREMTQIIHCRHLKSGAYSIPGTVTSICAAAFEDCGLLTSVAIPDSVVDIGKCAFCGCTGLTSVVIPGTITAIPNYAFTECTNLTSITVPDSVKEIRVGAFAYCQSLTSVTIPGSVEVLGEEVFADCVELTEIRFVGETQNFRVVDGVLFDRGMTRLIW